MKVTRSKPCTGQVLFGIMLSLTYIAKSKCIGNCGTWGLSMNFIASTNFSSENWSTGIGGGPNFLACTRSPQKGWSPKKGTMVVGHYIAWKERSYLLVNATIQDQESMKKLRAHLIWNPNARKQRILKKIKIEETLLGLNVIKTYFWVEY